MMLNVTSVSRQTHSKLEEWSQLVHVDSWQMTWMVRVWTKLRQPTSVLAAQSNVAFELIHTNSDHKC